MADIRINLRKRNPRDCLSTLKHYGGMLGSPLQAVSIRPDHQYYILLGVDSAGLTKPATAIISSKLIV